MRILFLANRRLEGHRLLRDLLQLLDLVDRDPAGLGAEAPGAHERPRNVLDRVAAPVDDDAAAARLAAEPFLLCELDPFLADVMIDAMKESAAA